MKTNKGFGLIEMVITMGILSVVMLGTAAAMHNAMLVQNTADAKNDLSSLIGSTVGQALNLETCTAAITQTTQNYNTSGLQFGPLKSGTKLSGYRLKTTEVMYSGAKLVGTGGDGVKAYYGTLSVTVEPTVAVMGGKWAPRIIASIYLQVAPTGHIIGCGPVLPDLKPIIDEVEADVEKTVQHALEFKSNCLKLGGFIQGNDSICHFKKHCENN